MPAGQNASGGYPLRGLSIAKDFRFSAPLRGRHKKDTNRGSLGKVRSAKHRLTLPGEVPARTSGSSPNLEASAQSTLVAATLAARSAWISRRGGWPKKRLYSRLNWLALS